ncbi:hypothetical protein DT076_13910 [Desertihabitans brevis]|uniref:Lipoprotein n=1 Tax=Desertihabitans brevis TaxID=2268447 RepID=A0A367YSY2_9ACTN|nr:hypothetical protein DT076_13910 [Desertihabitans brevis]
MAAVALAAVAGCAAPATALRSCEFGSDYLGTSGAGRLPAGSYVLRLTCRDADHVEIRLRTPDRTVWSDLVPCAEDVEHPLELTAPVGGDASLEVTPSAATGRVELHRRQGCRPRVHGARARLRAPGAG